MVNIFRPAGPPRLKHQKVGLRNLVKSGGVYGLLWEPGTMKTATTLDYLSVLALKNPTRETRVLVVAPLAAVDTWVGQARTFVADGIQLWSEVLGGSIRQKAYALAARGGNPFPVPRGQKRTTEHEGIRRSLDLTYQNGFREKLSPARGPRGESAGPHPRLIIESLNLDAFSSRASIGGGKLAVDLMVEAVKRYRPDVIVVDESHRIKSYSSNTSKALSRLQPLAKRRIILTGTVMPHSPLDVFGQWRFLDPYAFGRVMGDGTRRAMTWTNFRARFAKMGGYMGREVKGYQNLDEMRRIMSERSMVVRKRDVLDLPPVTDIEVPVHLSPAEQRAYDSMEKNLAVALTKGAFSSAPNRLAQLMRLRQLTSGYLPDDDGNLQIIGTSKLKVIRSIVEDTLAGEKRIVIFAHFRDELRAIAESLAKIKGNTVEVIDGGVSNEERLAIRRRFGSDDPARIILVAQVRTLSLAVNELVTASNAIYASLPQTRDDFIQSGDRLNRAGQTRAMTFWYALAPGTVDGVILQSHRDRTDLEASVIDHLNRKTIDRAAGKPAGDFADLP